MSEHIHHVTDDSFEAEVLRAPNAVLCRLLGRMVWPCKMIAPILMKLPLNTQEN